MKNITKKSKFILIILIFSIFAVTLTGCSAKYDYAPASGRIEIYNSTDEDSAWIDCSEYSTEHADYFFETTLKDKQKDSFVDTAEQILNDYPTDKIKFVVGTSFNTAYVGEVHNAKNTVLKSIDTFYFNIKDLSSVNLLVELNAKHYGEKIPYGLLYAYSYGQCKVSKYNLPKALNDSKLKETVNNNKDIADLNTFVFLSSFTTGTEKLAAQTLSIKLYELLGDQELQKIIEIADMEKQQNIFHMYVKMLCYKYDISTQQEIGVDNYCFYHTQKYIIAENRNSIRFFITPNYIFAAEVSLESYEDLKTLIQKSLLSFEKVNEFVGNGYLIATDFYISNEFEWSQTFGNYCNIHDMLYLSHEYCHVVMWNKYRLDTNWTSEVIADYCGIMFNDYNTEGIIRALMRYLDNDEHANKVYELLLKFQPTDKMELWDILGYVYEIFNPNQLVLDGRLPERISPSFCNYLLETYGKEKFMQICTTSYSTEMNIYGKTLEQLRSDWFASLQSRFE